MWTDKLYTLTDNNMHTMYMDKLYTLTDNNIQPCIHISYTHLQMMIHNHLYG